MAAHRHMLPDLSFEDCERARYARDPQFDGVFFICVTSTRIYCRPVCPARQPLSRNVRYLPSAAAAEAAGFRPCLRCRPETAQHSPAWSGARASVSRALRLIEDGALDEGGAISWPTAWGSVRAISPACSGGTCTPRRRRPPARRACSGPSG